MRKFIDLVVFLRLTQLLLETKRITCYLETYISLSYSKT